MKTKPLTLAACLFAVSMLTGCASILHQQVSDEVLTYPVPYDRAYLKTLEAADDAPGWILQNTNKEEGLIEMRQKGTMGDEVILLVKRIDKRTTSIEVAKNSQKVSGAQELLKNIDKVFIHYLTESQKQKAPSS